MSSQFDARVAELEHRARKRTDLDFDEVSSHLPEDPKARTAALATIMGFDAALALGEGVSIEQLEHHAESLRKTADLVQEEERRGK